jgi:hypothetical protein
MWILSWLQDEVEDTEKVLCVVIIFTLNVKLLQKPLEFEDCKDIRKFG